MSARYTFGTNGHSVTRGAQICLKKKPWNAHMRTLGKASLRAHRLANSSGKKCITFEKVSTAPGRRSKPLRSVFLRRDAQVFHCSLRRKEQLPRGQGSRLSVRANEREVVANLPAGARLPLRQP